MVAIAAEMQALIDYSRKALTDFKLKENADLTEIEVNEIKKIIPCRLQTQG